MFIIHWKDLIGYYLMSTNIPGFQSFFSFFVSFSFDQVRVQPLRGLWDSVVFILCSELCCTCIDEVAAIFHRGHSALFITDYWNNMSAQITRIDLDNAGGKSLTDRFCL